MAYLIASDFDGTLCQSDGICPEDREAIRVFRAAGNRFVIVTGRTYANAQRGFRQADFHDMDGFLCLSGALAATLDGRVLYDKRMSAARFPELIDFFNETGARYINLDIGTASYQLDTPHEVDYGLDWYPLEKVKEIETLTSMNVGYQNEARAYEICRILRERYGEMLTPLQNRIAIDMPPAGTNKATGAAYAAEMFGVAKEDVYTFGDSFNDADMLRTYHGYAIACAPEEVRNAAEGTVNRLHEVIERLL